MKKSLVSLAALSCLLLTPLFAQAPEKGSAAEENQKTDWAFTPNPDLPNVLILGDSISIGYTKQVRDLLKDKANVYRPMNGKRVLNCNGTGAGVANIDKWLEGNTWSVIHFNWGLHDLKHVKEAGGNDKSDDPNDPTQADIEEYTKNLRAITAKLKATGAELIFATTTPVVLGTLSPLRTPEAPVEYNAVAMEIMKENGITVNDLHAYTLPHLERWQQPKNVHFKPEGSEALAKQVAAAIEAKLPVASESAE